jgi:hypothetical protein
LLATPSEIGGYAINLDATQAAAFANAGGMMMQVDTRGEVSNPFVNESDYDNTTPLGWFVLGAWAGIRDWAQVTVTKIGPAMRGSALHRRSSRMGAGPGWPAFQNDIKAHLAFSSRILSWFAARLSIVVQVRAFGMSSSLPPMASSRSRQAPGELGV